MQRGTELVRTGTILRFSIHKRIEGGATNFHKNDISIINNVSVSTSGSKGVQQVKSGYKIMVIVVSVSTSGSKGVQHVF
mgnify:CR=1 FL=1